MNHSFKTIVFGLCMVLIGLISGVVSVANFEAMLNDRLSMYVLGFSLILIGGVLRTLSITAAVAPPPVPPESTVVTVRHDDDERRAA